MVTRPIFISKNCGAEKFNTALCKARCRVEHAFGQWKRRFSINHQGYRIAISNVPTAILASAILQNIAMNFKMPEIEEEDIENDNGGTGASDKVIEPQSEAAKRREGIAMRDQLVERFS